MRKYERSSRWIVWIGVFACLITLPTRGQTEEEEEIPWSVNEGTMIGVGGYNLMDSYLSPGTETKYTGPGVRIVDERMKMTHLANHRISRQQIISVDGAKTHNAAGSATEFAGFVDYTLAYHYHLPKLYPDLKLLAGAAVHGMGGFIYNTRNSNNPASGKGDLDLNLSLMGIYQWRIKGYPLTIRYQYTMPFAGLMFSPHYGQSYYEIFDLGNSGGIVKFNSFHNKFAMKHYITVDFPIHSFTVRAGFLQSSYRTDVNDLQCHIISRTFLIGLVKEFVSFGGRHARDTRRIRSSYY